MLIPRLTTEIPLARLLHLSERGTPTYRVTTPCDIMMHAGGDGTQLICGGLFWGDGRSSHLHIQASRERGVPEFAIGC